MNQNDVFLTLRDVKKFKVLENYQLLASRIKSYSDKAMQSFIEMLEEEPDYLPAVLGMATGFMMEKNQVGFINTYRHCKLLYV